MAKKTFTRFDCPKTPGLDSSGAVHPDFPMSDFEQTTATQNV
jgi:hypothetical protein